MPSVRTTFGFNAGTVPLSAPPAAPAVATNSNPPGLKTQATRPQPAFGNILASPIIGGIVNTVGRIQQDPILELMSIDLAGFIVPRTAMELEERGYDMGLETGIRESSGLFSIVFLSGWLAWGSTRIAQALTRRKAAKQTKQGLIPAIRWYKNHIHGETLEILGNQFSEALSRSKGKTLGELQHAFYDGMLRRVQSTSGHVAPTLITELENKVAIAQAQRPGMAPIVSGTLDSAQRNRLVGLLAKTEATTKEAMAPVVDFAKGPHSNLTTQVHVWKNPTTKLSDKSLPLLLQEMRTFWQQYVKGVAMKEYGHVLAGTNAGQAQARQHRHIFSSKLTAPFITQVHNRLFGPVGPMVGKGKPSALKRVWQNLFPSIKQGVLPYVLKRRTLLTALPYGLTLVLASGVAFLNNWLTARRHHGKVYFPGLGDVEKNGLVAASQHFRRMQQSQQVGATAGNTQAGTVGAIHGGRAL